MPSMNVGRGWASVPGLLTRTGEERVAHRRGSEHVAAGSAVQGGAPMKAIVVRRPGGPEPGPKDVIIEVAACGVCFHDIVTRNGTLKAGIKMPLILGHEIAGTVIAAGRAVRDFKPGDRVATAQRKFLGDWGMVGGYAQYVAVEDDNVARVPDAVPLEAASIVACTIGTIL